MEESSSSDTLLEFRVKDVVSKHRETQNHTMEE
jgi:hypothetical protein